MTTRAGALLATSLALMVLPASSEAAGWDPAPLPVSPGSGVSPDLGPVVETTDDGAAWVMWAENPDQDLDSDVIVIRVGPDGVPGERRVLTTTEPRYFGAIALAPLPGGDVRVAYATEMGAVLAARRLTPTSTGDPVVLYDKATTDDGNTADNGDVYALTARVLAAPDGASWVTFVRLNNSLPVVSARRIADDDTVEDLVALPQSSYEPGWAVDPSGRLIVAVPSMAQGRVVLVAIETDGTVGSEVELRPAYGSSAASNTPELGIDATGIATVGWGLDVPGTGRYIEARRVNTAATPMLPLGAGATAMNDDLPEFYSQYGPLLAVEPGGAALMGWYETDSFVNNNDAMVRLLAAGAFADTGVIGPRVHVDGPPPEGGSVQDLVPGPNGIVTAFVFTTAPSCRAVRIDTATGTVVGTDELAASCGLPLGPATAANGLVATWSTGSAYEILLKRYVTDPPACSDGAATTVAAGKTVTLALPCTGWRPQREIAGSPARGTLGAIDQAAGTVTYTAGAAGGADQVRFRAVNGAGASSERSISLTVTAPDPSPDPPPDTSDKTPPVLTGLSLKPKRLQLPKLRKPTLAFSLSEAATANVRVKRLVNGRRKQGRCVTKPRPRRGARCVKAKTVKRLSSALPAGAASLKLALDRPVRPGRYRVIVRATDAAGNISAAVRVAFTIARR